MISSIGKHTTYILCSILLILVTSCATLPNGSKNWSENTLKKLSLREKIGQMLIYRMNMRCVSTHDPERGTDANVAASSDGRGIVFGITVRINAYATTRRVT